MNLHIVENAAMD